MSDSEFSATEAGEVPVNRGEGGCCLFVFHEDVESVSSMKEKAVDVVFTLLLRGGLLLLFFSLFVVVVDGGGGGAMLWLMTGACACC